MSTPKTMTSDIVRAGVSNAMRDAGLESIKNEVMEVERVFIAWMENRSAPAQEIADEAAVDVKIVRKLLRSGEFQKRYLEETAAFREVAQEYTRGRAAEIMDSVLSRLTKIIEGGEDRDAIGAARVLQGMLQLDAPRETNTTYVDARALTIAGEGIKNVDDIKRIMAAQIDGNIAAVEAERSAKAR